MTRDDHLQPHEFHRAAGGYMTVAQARHVEACDECAAVAQEKYFDEALRNLNFALNYEPSDSDAMDAEPAPRKTFALTAAYASTDEAPRGLWLAAAASVVVCVIGLVFIVALFHRTETPGDAPISVASSLHGSPRWDDAVAESLERGRVDPASRFPTTTEIAPVADHSGNPKISTPLGVALLDVDAALRRRPTDHLLLGVLFARARMPADAQRELTEYLRTHPNDAGARRVLENTRVRSEGK